MARMRLLLWCSALLLAAGVATGCGDDPSTGTGPGDTGQPDTTPDAGPDTSDTTPTLHNQLVLVTEPEPSVSFSERVAMQVRYLDPDNNPIPDAFIQFAPQGDTGDTHLSAQNALTNTEGVAETFIEAGVQQLDFDVRVSVPSDDTVESLTIRVRIQPKDASDYVIRVTYDGPVTLYRVEVLLYDTDRACNTLVQDPEAAPSTDVAWTSLVILPDAEGNIPDRGLNVPRETTFHYAVARAEPTDGSGGGRGYFVTFGCNDQIPATDPASATVIEIDMHNLWPSVEGSYQIETEVNLLDAIPDSVQPIFDLVSEFFTDTGVGLLRIIATALEGEQYFNVSPWSLFFECSVGQNPDGSCPGEVRATTLGATAAGIIEALIATGIGLLDDPNDTGDAADIIRTVMARAADVFNNAEAFRMAGTLTIAQEPDASGYLGNTNEVVYNRLTWVWEGSDRTIDLRSESFLRGTAIEGALVFHPTDPEGHCETGLDGCYHISLSPFDLNLNYGEMLIWIVEGIVFPTFIDENVNSFEDLFLYLVPCDDLHDLMACEGDYDTPDCSGTLAFAAGAAEAACQSLLDTASEAIQDYLASLTLDLGTYYHMGTPPDDPCATDLEAGGDFQVQALGDSVESRRCHWDGDIRYSADDTEAEQLDGNWWGERL